MSGRSLARRAYSSASSDITVNAMVYGSYGKPSEVLKQLPSLTSDTVHVRFLASPINPADINQVQGVYPLKPPFEQLGQGEKVAVGGNEGVAQVIAVGDNVKNLKVGDQVVMARSGYGTWRTHAAGPEADFQLLPASTNTSLIQKATITVNPCTAYRMLKDFVQLKPGDYVIQNGGNSAVGQAVIQIAKAWGINTINVVRNRPEIEQLREELKELGATHVVTDEELGTYEMRSKMKEWFGGKPPLLGLNCVGGKSATEMARYLGHNGQYVTYGAMARAPLAIPASMLIFKNFAFHGFWMTRWTDTHTNEERYEMLKDLVELMDKGQLREPRWTEVAWSEQGMKQAADGGIQGFTQGKQVCFPTKA
ncbi:NAD(P)-binding protein [Lichtheimia hyalospora FSU 10163]|nr:NAD(P)-binding protein [Lichtheimia hyalospora FSU 10163]